ncbi:unnamed protein product [Nezara viridula]|uniref:IkappaB kinase n=1 Tax=Nezara viridula TaxID=85310 RepID=A0A9P0E4Y0_NEZVI|nr:unnamed protein product [Nezara viridula]
MNIEIKEVGNWYKEKCLGSGGFGIVDLWTNKVENTSIALKILRIQGSSDKIKSLCVERWAKEVEIMQRLSHPNVVKTITLPSELLCLSPEYPILCMEYCEKGDLRKVLNDPENCSGLPEIIVRKVLKNIKDAVEYLHNANITHRDLKPENIVMKENENNEVVFKLIDLGYAKELEKNSLCSSFVGTLQYVAPELFTQNYTSSVDYWSLGLVCHEIITGTRPFLPNMAPYSWMPLVQKKASDDICIYQNEDESIEYCKSLSTQNHISQTLRCELEDWLKLALEWNGKRRGRDYKNHLIIFSQLDFILAKKIMTVFSSVTLEVLSYEVDASTAVSTLKEWIKRDIKMPVAEQLLLLPTGEKIPDDSLACKFWDQSDQVAMIYMFHTNGLEVPYYEVKIPPLVHDMMDSPRTPHKYYFLKKMWASAVFFLQREVSICQAFMESYAVKLLSVILCNQQLISLEQSVNNELQQLLAYMKFFSESLDYDIKCWESVELQNQGVSGPDDWRKEEEQCKKDLSQLKQIGERLGYKIATVGSKLSKIQAFTDSFQNPLDRLKKLLEMAYTVFKNLQRRPKELRNSKVESVDLSMVKIINKSITERDAFYNDQALSYHLEEVKRFTEENLSIFSPLNTLKQHINRVKCQLRKSQLKRQKNIWQMMVDLKQNVPEKPFNSTLLKQVNGYTFDETTQPTQKNETALSRSKSFHDYYRRYHSSLYLYKQGLYKDCSFMNSSSSTNNQCHHL